MAKKGFVGTLRICALHNLKLGTLLGSCTFYNLQAWYTSRIYAPAQPTPYTAQLGVEPRGGGLA